MKKYKTEDVEIIIDTWQSLNGIGQVTSVDSRTKKLIWMGPRLIGTVNENHLRDGLTTSSKQSLKTGDGKRLCRDFLMRPKFNSGKWLTQGEVCYWNAYLHFIVLAVETQILAVQFDPGLSVMFCGSNDLKQRIFNETPSLQVRMIVRWIERVSLHYPRPISIQPP